MRTRLLPCALIISAVALVTPDLAAHGGIYRGPGDIVPPSPGGGRPTTPTGPAGPRTPGAGAPSAPLPTTPVGPGRSGGGRPSGSGPPGGSRTGGAALEPDLSTWDFWWEFNKHAYLGLRQAVHQAPPQTGVDDIWLGPTRREQAHNLLEPTRNQIQDEILPALKRAIDSTEQRDIVSSCMIAMAKVGQDHTDFQLVDVFRQRLARDNQEVQETAALALGIAAVDGNGALDLLVDVALDSEAARTAAEGPLSVRTRSFALYGLGLFANEHTNPAIKQRALATLRQVLADDRRSDRNLKVAAIQGIGMLAIERKDSAEQQLLDEALQTLTSYYQRDLGVGDQLIQAHCPTAIAKLLGRDHPRSDEFRQRFADELAGRNRSRRRSDDLQRSCVLALGRLCRPYELRDSQDAGYSQLLAETFETHKDPQTRYFALLALGQIGGAQNRALLLRTLHGGNKTLERPWAALALGVQSFASHARDEAAMQAVRRDEVVGQALLAELREAKAPSLVGALGIALGLNRNIDAVDEMQERLRAEPQKEEQAGYLCIGLALMKHRGALAQLQETLENASRRTHLFVQAAIALGCLGDKTAADVLHAKLLDESSNLATLAAIAEALGQIGDRRSVEPLTKVLFDSRRGDLQRAFAAVGLGGVADRATLPWHAEISTDINYRAAVETLTNQQSGVLDIL